MTVVRPVSAAEMSRAQRKAAPFRRLPDPPPMIAEHVTFTEQDMHAHQTPPLELPAPPPISVMEQLNLSRPITNTTALVAAAMTASVPSFTVTLQGYLRAEVRAYT